MTSRLLSVALSAALLIAGIYAATVRGVADVEYTKARLLIGFPELGKPAPKPEVVPGAQAALREALRLDPGNPHYVEQFARTQELKALALDPKDPAARQAMRQAAAALRLAARMRPGSPYVWADLARVKLRMDEMDFEFYGALDRARILGPWESGVQKAILDVGLASWRVLAVPARGWVISALDHALVRESHDVHYIAAAHSTVALLCSELALPPRVTIFCVKK